MGEGAEAESRSRFGCLDYLLEGLMRARRRAETGSGTKRPRL